ncbi:DNA-binding protein [Clostridium tetani]|uniref:helix-turn-helix domain-containing protein n=1 Tax=Clostridium tetani TaxID=1513 RepID=UPI000573D86C|nr:helix-turn-helix transcriptional regulator [Clostridium tetani]KHO39104.1 DNA-binding protein [Clostridium tetani]RXM68386.1 XRE family transcriptional regulator [Clostridium tetani]
MIGEKIQKLRKEKNLSLRALAEKAGISKSTLSDIENGNTNPTTNTLNKLATALNVSLEDLFKSEPITKEKLKEWDEKYLNLKEESTPYKSDKITDIKKAMDLILSQDSLMLNGEILSDESKMALANAIKMGLAYAEQKQKDNKK